MTLAGYVAGWAAEYAAGIERAAGIGFKAVDEYLVDMGAQWKFDTNKRGEFCGAKVSLAYSPAVDFNSRTGVIRVRDTSARQVAVVAAKVSESAREKFNTYFEAAFELSQASDDFDVQDDDAGYFDDGLIDIFAPMAYPESAE